MTRIRDDHDTPWKEALERYFPEFLALLFPDVNARIDWARGHVFLDKELQKVVRDAHQGRQYTDKLIRVHTREGSETWVLIHVEIQGGDEVGFAGRIFAYHYRLLDRYGVDVVSLAVLADDRPRLSPDRLSARRDLTRFRPRSAGRALEDLGAHDDLLEDMLAGPL